MCTKESKYMVLTINNNGEETHTAIIKWCDHEHQPNIATMKETNDRNITLGYKNTFVLDKHIHTNAADDCVM